MAGRMQTAQVVIPEAAEGGYPGSITQPVTSARAVRWIPALASLGRDDSRR
jgi:hypothetical protein